MRKPLLWLLVFTFLHGLWYAAIVHPWQAPDEFLHYEYMRMIDAEQSLDLYAEDRSADIQWPIAATLWDFQHFRYRNLPTPPENWYLEFPTPLGSSVFSPQPPFFYLISLPIYWALKDQPLLTHLYFLRTVSVLLQCVTVWLTYKIARLIFNTKGRPLLVLIPAALIALLPQYTFISASYNNDNLAPPLVTAALFFLVRGFRREANLGQFALAVIFGLLALTAKRTAVAIVPVLGLGLLGYAVIWMRSENRWARLSGAGIWSGAVLALLLLIGLLAHPPTIPPAIARHLRLSPNAFIQLSASLIPSGIFYEIDWRWFFSVMTESFWGWFGWLTVRVPQALREIFTLLTAALTLGVLTAIGRHLREKESDHSVQAPFAMALLLTGVLFTLVAMIAQFVIAPATYPPQGRYLFPFLPALTILGVWSWLSLWPRRLESVALILAWLMLAAYDVYVWAYVLLPEWYS